MPLPLAIPAIIAAVGAIASIGSSAGSAGASASAQKQLEERRDAENRRYAHESGIEFLDTEAAKSTLASLRRHNKKQTDVSDNNAVKQGLSDEAKVAQASKLNENYAEAATKLASMGTEYKQRIQDGHLRRLDSLDNAIHNSQLGKADAMNSMGQSIAGVASAAMGAYASGAFGSATTAGTVATGTTTPVPTGQTNQSIQQTGSFNYGQQKMYS